MLNIEQIKMKECGEALDFVRGKVVNIDLILSHILIGRWNWELKQIREDRQQHGLRRCRERGLGLWGFLLGLKNQPK